MPDMLSRLALPLALTTACCAQQSLSSLYTFQKVDYPNSLYSVPLGINNLRVVVGTFIDSNGISHGYTWKSGKFTGTIDFPGAPLVPYGGTTAGGINDRGDIAGTYTGTDGFQHGYTLAHPDWCGPIADELVPGCKPVFKPIDFPGAAQTNNVLFEFGPGLGTDGVGINNLGQVVGLYTTNGLYSNGFVESHSTYVAIDNPHSTHTAANGSKCFSVSNTGVVACDYQTQAYETAPQITHGFLRRGSENIPIEFPGSANDGFGTQVTGVNIFNVTVGVYLDTKAFNAMLWFDGHFFTVNYPGAPYSELHSISDRGDLTGAYSPDPEGSVLIGYVAFPKL